LFFRLLTIYLLLTSNGLVVCVCISGNVLIVAHVALRAPFNIPFTGCAFASVKDVESNLFTADDPLRPMHERPTSTRICDSLLSFFSDTCPCHISWGCPVIENDGVRVRFLSSIVSHAPACRIRV